MAGVAGTGLNPFTPEIVSMTDTLLDFIVKKILNNAEPPYDLNTEISYLVKQIMTNANTTQ
jgi:hypothetical protein